MTDIQKKALEHVKKLLSSYDTIQVYMAIKNALKNEGVSDESINKILDKYQDARNVQYQKLTESKDWIESLLKIE